MFEWFDTLTGQIIENAERLHCAIFYHSGFRDILATQLHRRENDYNKVHNIFYRPGGFPQEHLLSEEIFDMGFAKLLNIFLDMEDEKLAQDFVYRTLYIIEATQYDKFLDHKPEDNDRILTNPHQVILEAIENCKPTMDLKEGYFGCEMTKVVVPLNNRQGRHIALEWIIEEAWDPDQDVFLFPDMFAGHLIDAAHNVGPVVTMKNQLMEECDKILKSPKTHTFPIYYR